MCSACSQQDPSKGQLFNIQPFFTSRIFLQPQVECFVFLLLFLIIRFVNRLVHIAKIVIDKLSIYKTVIIRFLEAEGNVEGLTQKVKDHLGCDEAITLETAKEMKYYLNFPLVISKVSLTLILDFTRSKLCDQNMFPV